MNKLERLKMELEIVKVRAAKFEMEVRKEERLEEIERLDFNIANQQKRIEELEEKLTA